MLKHVLCLALACGLTSPSWADNQPDNALKSLSHGVAMPSTLLPLTTPGASVGSSTPDTPSSSAVLPSTTDVAVVPTPVTPLQGYAETALGRSSISVPAETVMQVALAKTLNTNQSKVGDTVTVSVKDPVYIGPYLAVPKDSTLEGKVTGINKKGQKDGPNPYITVSFTELKRPGETDVIPINAELIAYKTGLKKEDYLWKLPRKTNMVKKRLGNAAEGALIGFFANPILGPAIGAGAGVAMGMTIDKVAKRSSIRIKPGEVIPIAVQDAFKVAVVSKAE